MQSVSTKVKEYKVFITVLWHVTRPQRVGGGGGGRSSLPPQLKLQRKQLPYTFSAIGDSSLAFGVYNLYKILHISAEMRIKKEQQGSGHFRLNPKMYSYFRDKMLHEMFK